MKELRFDGRTAIVTGSGGNPSLGRAHAMLLGARGANVVVNDIGSDPEHKGFYKTSASAEAVAKEIRDRGGKAVADSHSVATEDGAKAIIKTALDAFGSIDIVVNNAVVGILKPFEEMTSRDIERHIEVGLYGPIWMCRAAWPHMQAKKYGRIVNITSAAMTGSHLLTIYGAVKGGIYSLTRGLAAEGEAFGIKVNSVNPGAFTRGAQATIVEDTPAYKHMMENLPAELVAPAVAFLSHEICPVTGECLDASGGIARRIYYAQTKGIVDRNLTMETIAERWSEIMGPTDPGLLSHSSSSTKGVLKRTA